MKYLVLLCCCFSIPFYSQSNDCIQKVSDYQNLFKAKKIEVAYIAWSEAKLSCGTSNETLFKDGIQIIQAKIKSTKLDSERERLLREGLKLFEDYHKYFPATTADYQVSKAMLIYNNSVRADQQIEEIYSLLENGISSAPHSIKDINAINLYFNLYCNKIKNKEISSDGVTEKYLLIHDIISNLSASDPKNAKGYQQLTTSIDNLAKKTLTADNLTQYYQSNLATNQTNGAWLELGVANLAVKCSNKPVFYSMATAWYQYKATAKSASYLGLANAKQKKYTEAVHYYEEAVALEADPKEKAKLYFTLASLLGNNDKSNARLYYNQALQFDPKMTKVYLAIAQLYADSKECATTDFDKKAVLYLAIQTANKQLSIDTKTNPALDKFIAKYTNDSLTPKEISKAHLNGKTYAISCWMNESIIFPEK